MNQVCVSQERLCARFEFVRQKIIACCTSFERNPHDLQLIAVSKGRPVNEIRLLYAKKQHQAFGENRVSELEEKALALSDLNLSWHYIGRIQTRALKKIVQFSAFIHSLDRVEHARQIIEHARELKKPVPKVFLCLNLGDEKQKSGLTLEELPDFLEALKKEASQLPICGLFAIPPVDYQDEKWFAGSERVLPDIYQRLAMASKQVGLGELSLGMSGDMAMAIAAGTRYLRIGRAIFLDSH